MYGGWKEKWGGWDSKWYEMWWSGWLDSSKIIIKTIKKKFTLSCMYNCRRHSNIARNYRVHFIVTWCDLCVQVRGAYIHQVLLLITKNIIFHLFLKATEIQSWIEIQLRELNLHILVFFCLISLLKFLNIVSVCFFDYNYPTFIFKV